MTFRPRKVLGPRRKEPLQQQVPWHVALNVLEETGCGFQSQGRPSGPEVPSYSKAPQAGEDAPKIHRCAAVLGLPLASDHKGAVEEDGLFCLAALPVLKGQWRGFRALAEAVYRRVFPRPKERAWGSGLAGGACARGHRAWRSREVPE